MPKRVNKAKAASAKEAPLPKRSKKAVQISEESDISDEPASPDVQPAPASPVETPSEPLPPVIELENPLLWPDASFFDADLILTQLPQEDLVKLYQIGLSSGFKTVQDILGDLKKTAAILDRERIMRILLDSYHLSLSTASQISMRLRLPALPTQVQPSERQKTAESQGII